MNNEQKKQVKAIISVYCGGNYGRSGEYIALIEPEYFKNGNIKKQSFKIIKELEIVRKWYAFKTAKVVHSIKEILND